ncbi:amidase [Nguyenibacter vanlangensis]|uniref:Amidase n=1 Tax=Nguyenibacter vanlangensis TaxID=1216886 RepID=A0ABZ3DA45_9PROT
MSERPADMAVAATARIARHEPRLRAFTSYDPVRLRQDAEAAPAGPLGGLSVGVKDIIDTGDYPTAHGSPIYAANHPRNDAACVALLKAAGALCVGKTVTTEFAFFRPGPTVNPHDVSRSPGGSSSGSAAAVAAGMIDIGLASQTAASLTRPASYCGIVGFKPSYGRYALAGVKGLAPSFDTLGTVTGDVATAARADAVLRGPVPASPRLDARPPGRIGLCRTPWWPEAEPSTWKAVEDAAARFRAAVPVDDVDLADYGAAADLHITIMSYEAAQALTWEYACRRDMLSPQVTQLIETGRAIPYETYRDALRQASLLRQRVQALFDRYDALIAPAAPGEAPLLEHGTGSPIFSRLWTLLRLPTITLPGLTGVNGLPVGVQLLSRFDGDDDLLDWAAWAEKLLPLRPAPALGEG